MPVYLVERDVSGISMDDLLAIQDTAIAKAREMTTGGAPIRHLRSTLTPDDGRCYCLFEAQSDADVRRLNEEARLPFRRVVGALELTRPVYRGRGSVH